MEPFRIREQKYMKIRALLERGIYHAAQPLRIEANVTRDPVPFADRGKAEMRPLVPGQHWGDLFDCAWMHFMGNAPDEYPPDASGCRRKHWAVLIDVSAEGLVYDRNGEPVQGLTSATSRNEFPLGLWGKRTVEWKDCLTNGSIDFWADFTCCDVEGQYRNGGRVKEACTAWVDDLCRDTFYDWVVCLSLFVGLMENGVLYGEEVGSVLEEAAEVLERSYDLFHKSGAERNSAGTDAFKNRDAYFVDDALTVLDAAGERISILPDAETEPTKRCQIVLDQGMLEGVRRILRKILDKPNPAPSLVYSAMGHSHLDLLFLWPERETYRKCARTLSNVLRIMELDPTCKFVLSQAPVYRWLKEQYPGLYGRLLARMREGRIEAVGATYIECDTNLPGGESLVRQLLYGKRFFREEFGQEMRVCFLPDCFGYSAALPQLLKLADVPYFITNKLSMNDTNRFPRYTFWWYGLDGSRVLTHMPPENSYTSAAVPQMALYGEHHYTDIDVCPRGLQLYGLGDGGGGPGPEHAERRKRIRNLAGCPPFEDEFVVDFFDRIAGNADRYRSWRGELYLERHQGTYTSIARQKYWNRTLEKDLHALEFASALADGLPGYRYPAEWLKKAWEEVLLYQFHDCLPGSSINLVYEQTQARYAELHAEAQTLTAEALTVLSKHLGTEGTLGRVCLNPCPFEMEANGILLEPYSIRFLPGTEKEAGERVPLEGKTLENERVRIVFTEEGTVSQLYDKETGRSLLREGEYGNVLTLYPDELTHWDINKSYLKEPGKKAVCTGSAAYREDGKQILELTFLLGERSFLRQTVILKDHEKRIDFQTEADWEEDDQMLRVAFPTAIVTDHAQCAIQFGHVSRPTHRNTSWEEAKFEVCAHPWTDLSDADGGLALLSDCKYGYKIWDNALDMCLLRSQSCPAERGDAGHHSFTYALLPHGGDVWNGGVISEGYRLNGGTSFVQGVAGGGPKFRAPFRVASGTVVLETIKRAEDGNGLILRLYEARGGATRARIELDDYETVCLCNLLEEPTHEQIRAGASAVELSMHPFEIRTIRIRKKGTEQR